MKRLPAAQRQQPASAPLPPAKFPKVVDTTHTSVPQTLVPLQPASAASSSTAPLQRKVSKVSESSAPTATDTHVHAFVSVDLPASSTTLRARTRPVQFPANGPAAQRQQSDATTPPAPVPNFPAHDPAASDAVDSRQLTSLPTSATLHPQSSSTTLCRRPRAFINPANSCYINAALQACFALDPLRALLTELIDRVPSDVMHVFWPVATQQHAHEQRRKALHVGTGTMTWRLAVTCKASFQPPLSTPLMPYLFTDVFYDGSQQDVTEFLQRVLFQDVDGLLSALFTGGERNWMQCTVCRHDAPSQYADFPSLQLPILTSQGAPILSVTEALENYFLRDLAPRDIDFHCRNCGSRDTPMSCKTCTLPPRVLMLTLTRTCPYRGPHGINHRVTPCETLQFEDAMYTLSSVIMHQGPSIHAGHYTCLVHHPNAEHPWWYYDDHRCRPATAADRLTSDTLRSYVAVYQQVGAPA